MALSSIRLQNFRSYKDAKFDFVDTINIVAGPNASGKTNLLEAVLILCAGTSYKAKDQDLVKIKTSWARLDGAFQEHQRVVKIQTNQGGVDKTIEIGGKPYKRLNFEKTLPVVLFEPDHLQLFARGPEQRREFIDGLLQRSQPGLKTVINKYQRTLAQRNSLLKQPLRSTKDQIFVWNLRLADLGSQLAQARQNLIDDINKSISRKYSAIAGRRSKVRLEYASHFPIDQYATKMLSKLEKELEDDMTRGFTTHGPHREDILFELNNQRLGQTSSRGEARSLLLALKLYELELVKKHRGEKPIFLLDDVFSELDSARRKALVETIKNYQAILTTSDAEATLGYLTSGSHKLVTL